MKLALLALGIAFLVGCSSTWESPFKEGPPSPPVDVDEREAADPPSSSASAYTVRRGDSLWSISKQFYGSGKHYKRIVDANPGLDPRKLQVGQRINIPER